MSKQVKKDRPVAKSSTRIKMQTITELLADGKLVSAEIRAAARISNQPGKGKAANSELFKKPSESRKALKIVPRDIEWIVPPEPDPDEEIPDVANASPDTIIQKIDDIEKERQSETIEVLMQSQKPPNKGRQPRPSLIGLREVEHVSPIRVPDRCKCGGKMQVKGRKMREILGIKPMELLVQRPIYRHMRCCRCGYCKWDESPNFIRRGSNHSFEFAAESIVQKYGDGLPIFRQASICSMNGIDVHAKTLWGLQSRVEDYLRVIYFSLMREIRSAYCIQMDETPIQALGINKKCYAWGALVDERRWRSGAYPMVGFMFEDTRSHTVPKEFLMNSAAKGVLVDGHAAYNILKNSEVMDAVRFVANCNTHARRRFVKIVESKTDDGFGQLVLDHYADVYRVENSLYGKSPEQRVRGRLQSRMTMRNLRAHMIVKANEISEKSDLSMAIHYFLRHYESLTYFLTDGRVEADTNLMENQIRPIAMLRKACLFAGSLPGGEMWMVFASLIGTCRLNGVNPRAYFLWVLQELNDNYVNWNVGNGISDERARMLLPWHCPHGRFGFARKFRPDLGNLAA